MQKAREDLAGRLREIRRDAGISGRELAVRCGWSESKSSRMENAKTAPSDADIRSWCRACCADDQVLYVSDVIPGFLQVPAYATALLSSIADFRGTPDDVSDAVAARMRRNAVLSHGARRFSFVLEEAVLRYRMYSPQAMAAQLGHLLGVMDLRHVSVGIVPFSTQRTVWPMPTFTIFDDTRVHADTLDAASTLTQPSQVELYARAYVRLSQGVASDPARDR